MSAPERPAEDLLSIGEIPVDAEIDMSWIHGSDEDEDAADGAPSPQDPESAPAMSTPAAEEQEEPVPQAGPEPTASHDEPVRRVSPAPDEDASGPAPDRSVAPRPAPHPAPRPDRVPADLPRSPLEIRRDGGRVGTPKLTSAPDEILAALTERLVASLVRSGHTEHDARVFARDGLSRAQLVLAFLLAALDLPVAPAGDDAEGLSVDPATYAAAAALRATDPLMSSVLERVGALEADAADQTKVLRTLSRRAGDTERTARIVEAVVSFLVAAQVEHADDGYFSAADVDVDGESASRARVRFRRTVTERLERERRSDGRPIR